MVKRWPDGPQYPESRVTTKLGFNMIKVKGEMNKYQGSRSKLISIPLELGFWSQSKVNNWITHDEHPQLGFMDQKVHLGKEPSTLGFRHEKSRCNPSRSSKTILCYSQSLNLWCLWEWMHDAHERKWISSHRLGEIWKDEGKFWGTTELNRVFHMDNLKPS